MFEYVRYEIIFKRLDKFKNLKIKYVCFPSKYVTEIFSIATIVRCFVQILEIIHVFNVMSACFRYKSDILTVDSKLLLTLISVSEA